MKMRLGLVLMGLACVVPWLPSGWRMALILRGNQLVTGRRPEDSRRMAALYPERR